MSDKKRKFFSAQQKAKVALEAIRGVKTVNEIAQQFEVHPTQVGQWKKELQDQATHLFEGKRGPKSMVDPAASPERLYAEIGRLKMELDWLKKNRRYSCEHTPRLDRHAGATRGVAPVFAGRCGEIRGLFIPLSGE